jgi:hypothetical protein
VSEETAAVKEEYIVSEHGNQERILHWRFPVPSHPSKLVFGDQSEPYLAILGLVAGEFRNHRYEYTSIEDFTIAFQSEIRQGIKIYWTEILFRAHLASMVTLLRNERWTQGVLSAVEQQNLPLFAAATRGLMESVADSFHALEFVPAILAEHRDIISRAVSGELDTMIMPVTPAMEPIETRLIHFSHARKVGKQELAPDYHQALLPRDYIDNLAKGDKGRDYYHGYQELCQIVHPAQRSVFAFLDVTRNSMTLRSVSGIEAIQDFCERFREILKGLLVFGVNPAIITLKLLNLFKFEIVYTSIVDRIDMSGIPYWTKVQQDFGIP